MTGYTFVYGVDGFGADTAPAYELGVYLNEEKAFAKFKEITKECLKTSDRVFYEDGWCEDSYPEEYNKIMEEYEKNEDWGSFSTEYEKHILTDLNEICKRIMEYDEPPYGFYQIVEVEVI